MSKYQKGANMERAVINLLKENGYTTMRGAGSKSSTEADIIAIRYPHIYLIQCKANKLSLSMNAKLVLDIAAKVREEYYYVKPLALSENWKEEIKVYL